MLITIWRQIRRIADLLIKQRENARPSCEKLGVEPEEIKRTERVGNDAQRSLEKPNKAQITIVDRVLTPIRPTFAILHIYINAF